MHRNVQHKSLGKDGEAVAAQFLCQRGYRIAATNYRCVEGEIDIIAWDNHTLVFIEVKARRNCSFGLPYEAVGYRKQTKIRKVALFYLANHRMASAGYRFDVLSLILDRNNNWRVEHILNAF